MNNTQRILKLRQEVDNLINSSNEYIEKTNEAFMRWFKQYCICKLETDPVKQKEMIEESKKQLYKELESIK